MDSRAFDVTVVGGGILGLATAMQLIRRCPPSMRIAVVEKEADLATHQTGHNSGVIHSGIYYRPGSHKARFCVAGVNKLVQFCDENEIEYQRCGKVIVATDHSEIERLEELHRRGTANGVEGLELVGPERLREIEPHAFGIRALWSPNTGIVDYGKVSEKYALLFREDGGEIFTDAPVVAVRRYSEALTVETSRGSLQTKHIINCAGLYADRVARMMGEETQVQIIPFRGEYYTLRPGSEHLVNGLIYPVPDPRFPFLGVHYTRNIKGYVEAGPNAVLALKREGYRKSDINLEEAWGMASFPGFWRMATRHWRTAAGEMYRSYSKQVFVRDLQRLVPEIRDSDLAPGGAGVRAQAVDRSGALLDDFNIIQGRNAVHVLNAPSPGATSSQAIGEHIASLAVEAFGLVKE